MQAGFIDEEGEVESDSPEAESEAVGGSAPSASMAAVEGLLSNLALSDQATDKATAAMAAAPQAAPGDGALPEAQLASEIEAADAEPDVAATAGADSDAGNDRLVEEAGAQLAQLQLRADAGADDAHQPGEDLGIAAEEPQPAAPAATVTAADTEGADGAAGPGKPVGSKRGSHGKKVLTSPLQSLSEGSLPHACAVRGECPSGAGRL